MIESNTTLELSLFGTIELKVAGARVQSSLSAKGRLLLAFLAIHSGRPVSTHRIADALFGDSLSADPHTLIKKTVQQVRQALREDGSRLTAPAPRMLQLDLKEACVDWALFHNACHRGDEEALQHAVVLHSRPFLEDVPLPWAVSEQRTCLLRRQKALENLFQQAMTRADWEQAGGRLSQMLTFELPDVTLDETLWCAYFETLLQQEEFGKIRRHYLHLQTFLERTEGRLPAPQTQAFWQRLPVSVRLQTAQSKKGSKRPTLSDLARLPLTSFPLIGREAEKQALLGAFDRARLVTVVGTGGVGKTRLVIQTGPEIAAAYQLDIGFLDLTSCAPDNVLRFVAHTLGVREEATTPPARTLQEFLSPKRLLLLWDNCEHCIEEVAELALALLQHCPHLRLLLTSRERLRIEGEQVFPLAPLGLPKEGSRAEAREGAFTANTLARLREAPAVRLFLERAAAASPGFRWTPTNAQKVIELCGLVDGLPLGIEIVASQMGCVPLEQIVADLSRSTLQMEHLQRGISSRHRTLQAALDYSHGLLNAAEQTLLRRLSVFAGGWTLEAAEAVCADDSLLSTQIFPALSGLVSKSLGALQGDGPPNLPYHFLETIRIFSLEKLREAGEERPVRAKHGDYFRRFCRQTHDIARIEQSVPQMLAQKSNIHAAIQWSLIDPDAWETGANLCHLFREYWIHTGLVREGLTCVDALLKQEAPTPSLEARSHLHLTRASLAKQIAQRDIANVKILYLEKALEGYCALNNRRMECEVYFQLASIATTPEEGRSFYRRALNDFRVQNEQASVAHTLLQCGLCAYDMGDYALAETEFREGLQVAEAGGYASLRALALMFLGTNARSQGDVVGAEKLYTESLTFYQSLGSGWAIRSLTFALGECKRCRGDLLTAKALLREGARLTLDAEKEIGAPNICVVAQLLGDLEDGETALFLLENLCHLTDPCSRQFQEYQAAKIGVEQHLTVAQRQKISAEARVESLEQLAESALEALQ